MSTSNLPQHVADALFRMEKHRVSDDTILFDSLGQSENIRLVASDRSEEFLLDLSRGRSSLIQVSMQNRAKQDDTVLVRLDLNGPRHRNPDGAFLPTPHLHQYRQGFGDSWAEIPPAGHFTDLTNELTTLREFMVFCSVTKPPFIRLQGGLSI